MLVDVAGIEPATPCLQSGKPNLSNLAGADACRLKLTSCNKTRQDDFVTFIRLLFANCPLLPRLVLRFYYGGRAPAFQTGDQGTERPKAADISVRTAHFERRFLPSVPLFPLGLFRFRDSSAATFAVTFDASTL